MSLLPFRKVRSGIDHRRSAFVFEDRFWEDADTMQPYVRAVLASASTAVESSDVMESDSTRFLSQPIHDLLPGELLQRLLVRIREWGKGCLGTRGATTPTIKIYGSGCGRELSVGGVPAAWHYILCCANGSGRDSFLFRLLQESSQSDVGGLHICLDHLTTFKLSFNQLLVISPGVAYDVSRSNTSSTSISLFIEGYLL